MEVFEVEKRQLKRQSTIDRRPEHDKFMYFTAIAGIILLTSAILVVMHFVINYKILSEEISLMGTNNAEKLLSRPCNDEYCFSKDCVNIASRILEMMNPEADPCNDFHEYACGGYRKKNVVPYGHDSYSPAEEAQKNILISIRKLMESLPAANESPTLTKIRRFYNTCFNAGQRDSQQNYSLSFWFSDIGSPLESIRNVDLQRVTPSDSWRRLLSKLEEYQIHTILKPQLTGSPPDTIMIDCSVPFLDLEAYLNSTSEKDAIQMFTYKEILREGLKLLALDKARQKQLALQILQLETDIARSIKESSSLSSDLSEAHNQQMREIWLPVIGEAVREMEIVSTCKHNLENILNILNNAPPQIASNYVAWRMLIQLMQYLGSGFRKLHIHYISKLPGFDYAYTSKWEECSDVVRQELGLAVAKELVEANCISPDTIAAMKEYFLEVKTDFEVKLNSVPGMDDQIKSVFSDKVRNMKLEVGYSEILNQSGVIDNIYRDYEVENNYFINIVNLKRFKARHLLTRHWYGNPDNPISEVSLEDSPLGSKSGYDYVSNKVKLDFGLMYPPLFLPLKNAPNYLKYGQSSVLAREMARAFDITGILYDANGEQIERILWSTVMEQKYEHLTSCLRHQASYFPSEIQTKATSADGLNYVIADLGSFLITFEGLLKHLRQEEDEKLLPGLRLTKTQIYYLQTAQTYCELRAKPSSDPQVQSFLPPKFRVNGVISNMENFGNVFNCPRGSAMDPERKCKLF